MHEYAYGSPTVKGDRRVVWHYDILYEVEPAGDDEEFRRYAEEESRALECYDLVALTGRPQVRVECSCPKCDGWHDEDPEMSILGGIVTDGSEKELLEIATGQGWL